MVSKFRAPLIILLVNCCLSSTAYTCEYTVRDTGFVQIYDTPYRLFGYIGKDTPRDVVSTLKQISAVVLMDSNVEFSLINIDQDKGHRAMEYLRRWEINSLPGLILVAPDGRSLPLSITTTDKSFKEQLWTKLEQIVESPKRDEILAHIVKSYCVIVLVEGKEASTNKKVRETILNATEQIKQQMSQMTKPIEAPPRLVVINSDNLAQENVLLWSLGINPEEINDPYLAVLYGRGRLMGPVFKDSDITAERLANILMLIGASCECGLDRGWLIGWRIPLRWEMEIQGRVVKQLGFDAESPMVKAEMSRILAFDSPGVGRFGPLGQIEGKSDAAMLNPSQIKDLSPPPLAEVKTSSKWLTTLLTAGGMTLLILAGGIILILRARSKTP